MMTNTTEKGVIHQIINVTTNVSLNVGYETVGTTPFNFDDINTIIKSKDDVTGGGQANAIITAVVVFAFPFVVLSTVCFLRHRVSKLRKNDPYPYDQKSLEILTTSTCLPLSSVDTHLTARRSVDLRRYKKDYKQQETFSTVIDLYSGPRQSPKALSESKGDSVECLSNSSQDQGKEHPPIHNTIYKTQ